MDAQTSSQMSFNFRNVTKTYTHNISENVVIHIDKIINSVATLYFTNKYNEKIDIPSGLVVYEYDFQTKEKLPLKSIQHHFLLCWTDNYTIEMDNKIILDIKNEREWTITR